MYQLIVKHLILKIDNSIAVSDFENGADAIARLTAMPQSEWPQVIFLDINMPIMDGWQFLAEAESTIPTLSGRCRIYMLSTSIDNRDKDRADALPSVYEYICKPVTMEKLKEIVEQL